ncbi:immunity 50 family protein [Burkholderia sp. SRS-W-2-2016]|uniref:immunity 50 family protein n=1 Tax=Burkholderia sp. SRS-W-2-2016 TaxID=1926878 RepID=UPI000A7F6623|nr:immunity 50 family protein [Burkholderia sp. SRS-W-2-2016]
MVNESSTWGWELAENNDLLLKAFGYYPSFHDSAVVSVRFLRNRRSHESTTGERLPHGQMRYLLDIQLEILHGRYCAPPEKGKADYLVIVDLLDIRNSEIDVNVMLEDAAIADINLFAAPGGLVGFDLMPSIGLDIKVTCKNVAVAGIKPYQRTDF